MSTPALAPITPPTVTTTQRNALTASEGDVVKNSTTGWMEAYIGGAWVAVGTGKSGQITVGFDGGGSAITSGKQQDLLIPFTGTLTDWAILGDQSGSVVIDIYKKATFPPSAGDTITASAKPTVSAATSGSSSSLTGWTTSITAGHFLRVNLDSVSSFTRLLLIINYTKA